MFVSFLYPTLLLAGIAVADLTSTSLEKYVDVLALESSFAPIIPSYWTGFPHHRRTPFALSPDGKTAYLAYLDASGTGVHIQQLDPSTFTATGSAVTVNGKEAGGLVAHNDGFALLTNEVMPSGTANAPPNDVPVPVLYRYTNGQQTFKTWLGGPDVHPNDGFAMSPDLNGDLVFSEAAGLYGAYFVVTEYQGWAAGHFGDSVEYVSTDGSLQTLAASSAWGCSHNTGIAFEAADSPPYASICAEDHGAIWLNTDTRGMAGVKISNENVQNGASNEPMGGMSGSYSGLARFINVDSYIFTWVSRGAINLTPDDWMGSGYTQAANRTNNRNVAIATFSNKNTLNGPQAISTVGAASGDDQVNWITQGTSDCSNAHVAPFDSTTALVTWEEAANPNCPFIAMGCSGEFTGTYFQLVDNTGKHMGTPISSIDTYVAGDMVTFPDGRICWPYVNMAWSLEAVADRSATTSKISFACMSNGGSLPTHETSSSTTPSSQLTTGTPSSFSTSSVPTTTPSAASSLPSFLSSTTSSTTTTYVPSGSLTSEYSPQTSSQAPDTASFATLTSSSTTAPSTTITTESSSFYTSTWVPTTLATMTTSQSPPPPVPIATSTTSEVSTTALGTASPYEPSGVPIELICWHLGRHGRGKKIFHCETE